MATPPKKLFEDIKLDFLKLAIDKAIKTAGYQLFQKLYMQNPPVMIIKPSPSEIEKHGGLIWQPAQNAQVTASSSHTHNHSHAISTGFSGGFTKIAGVPPHNHSIPSHSHTHRINPPPHHAMSIKRCPEAEGVWVCRKVLMTQVPVGGVVRVYDGNSEKTNRKFRNLPITDFLVRSFQYDPEKWLYRKNIVVEYQEYLSEKNESKVFLFRSSLAMFKTFFRKFT